MGFFKKYFSCFFVLFLIFRCFYKKCHFLRVEGVKKTKFCIFIFEKKSFFLISFISFFCNIFDFPTFVLRFFAFDQCLFVSRYLICGFCVFACVFLLRRPLRWTPPGPLPPDRPKIRPIFTLSGSSRGMLVVFEATRHSNVHLWALGLSCETPAAFAKCQEQLCN